MSRINQSHRGAETQGLRDGATGRRGKRQGAREIMPSLLRSFAPSPLRLVSPSLRLCVSVAIALVLFAAACRRDMQDQPKYKPLAPSRFFSDGKSARQLVDGTVAYSPEGKATSPMADLSKMTTLPFALTRRTMDRGQERFDIYCSPCHGRLGYGNGMVVQRGFRAPPSYHIDRLRQAPVGHFYDVMTNGFGAMPSYADKVAPDDRWAVTAYIRALQLSQHATINDAPPEDRAKLQSGGQKQ
ncbi:MAG TPA: cytochrome c [Blastocatellia bacterium]|nr:cytochrome c [Blastocatellia bacterium]